MNKKNAPARDGAQRNFDKRVSESRIQVNCAKPTLSNIELEKAVLGSLIVGGRTLIDELGAAEIDPTLFFYSRTRTIVGAIAELYDEGAPIDLQIVTERLRRHGNLGAAGGAATIAALGVDGHADVEVARFNLNELRDLCAKRQLARLLARAEHGEIDLENAKAQLDSIVAAAGNCRNGLPGTEDISELISRPIVLPDDAIKGMLSEGGKMVLGGGSKSFKTWQLIDLATAVASGTEFLGFATKKGRVLYINLELQREHFSWRIQIVLDKKSVILENGSFDVWNLRGHAAELYKLLPAILSQAGNGKYAVIIIDPIYKVLGEREENVTHHITAIMNDLERIAVHSGAAVAFGAHFSKGNQAGKESIDRIGGSGAFGRDPDSILIFTRHEEQDAFTVEATLRNHPPIDPFVVRWQFPLMQRDDSLDPNRLKQAGAPRKATPGQVLDLLSEKPLRTGEWQKRAKEELDLGRSTFFDMKSELLTQGRVESIAGFYSKRERNVQQVHQVQ